MGEQFIARLKPALDGIDDAVESLAELRGRPSGLLRLTALRTGYTDVLKPNLAGFLAAYPDIRLDISVDESLTNIVAEGLDAGLRLGESLDREMIAVRVSADQQVVVVGAPSYFERRGKPAHPRDLHAHDCIRLRKIGWRFRDKASDFEVAVDGHIVTNDGAVVVDAAVEGLGLAYVFENMAHEFLVRGRLVCALEQYCPRIPGYFLYYPSRAHVPAKLKAFIEFIRTPHHGRAPAGSSSTRASRRR
jgi:DNA-binding transcriptional LysR family regulator